MNVQQSYMQWLADETATRWWHDSADPDELILSLAHGATGVTTNPILANAALRSNPDFWADRIPNGAVEDCMRAVVSHASGLFLPEFERTGGQDGSVCAQVDPSLASDRAGMLAMAKRHNGIGPNIAVKLPVTAAGLDVLEECTAQGITITGTVSFTVPQVIAIAEAHRRGIARAKENGVTPGRCYAVIMIGRIDDYLRDVAHDSQADVSEADIRTAGIAITKRAYGIFRERAYEAELVIAALRGPHHMVEVSGAELIMSIHPAFQQLFLKEDMPREERISHEVDDGAVSRLETIPDFVRAYEPAGMEVAEFVSYGATQRTLAQFVEGGWKGVEAFLAAR